MSLLDSEDWTPSVEGALSELSCGLPIAMQSELKQQNGAAQKKAAGDAAFESRQIEELAGLGLRPAGRIKQLRGTKN